MAAGLAATAASFVTSRFGVAGTLLGAALTAMIITGGSAILRSYLESVSGRVRGMPKKLRSRRGQQEGGGFGGTMPGRPDLRDNFVGRMRAALDWFSTPADTQPAFDPHKGLPGRRRGVRDLHGRRVGGREGYR